MPSAVAASATEKVRFCFAAGGVSSPEAVLSSGTGQDRNQSVRSGLAAVLVAGRFRVCCLSCAEHSRRSGPGSGARPAAPRCADPRSGQLREHLGIRGDRAQQAADRQRQDPRRLPPRLWPRAARPERKASTSRSAEIEVTLVTIRPVKTTAASCRICHRPRPLQQPQNGTVNRPNKSVPSCPENAGSGRRRWDGVRRSQDPSVGPSRLDSSRRRDCRRDPRLPHNEHPRRRRRAAAGRDIRRR